MVFTEYLTRIIKTIKNIPMHPLGPPLNGIKLYLCLLAILSGVNLSGSYLVGFSYMSSLMCNATGHKAIVHPCGTV